MSDVALASSPLSLPPHATPTTSSAAIPMHAIGHFIFINYLLRIGYLLGPFPVIHIQATNRPETFPSVS